VTALALTLWWFVVVFAAPPITLTVTPRMGLGPLTVHARAACDARREGERVFEIVVLEGDEPIAVRRSELDVDAQLQAHPDAVLRHAATFTLPAGEYLVAACFQPGSRCSAPITVSAR
jgi:hypothetical protein